MSSSRSYRLFVRRTRKWETLCVIEASSHREAFGKAMLLPSPDLYDKPIKLEELAAAKAPKRGRRKS